MNRRIRVEAENGSSVDLTPYGNVRGRGDIKQVWTLYDEKRVVEYAPFNPYTGEKVTDALNALLQNDQGVVLEDYVHDWNIRDGQLFIYSRYIKKGNPITLIIELREPEQCHISAKEL